MRSGIAARRGKDREGVPPSSFSRNNYIAEGAHLSGPRKIVTQHKTGVLVADFETGEGSRRSRKQYDVASSSIHLLYPRRRRPSPRRRGTSRNPRTSSKRTSDEDANVVSRVTRGGAILNYVYDLLDRLHEKDISALSSNAHELTWTYTLAGRTTFIDDSAGQAILTSLDSAGRPISDTASVSDAGGSLTVAWTLDKSGNRTQLKWPDAYAVDYAFDGLGRLSAVTEDSTSAPLAAYSYDPLSRRTALSYNGGTSSMAYSYTDAGDLTSLSDDLAGTANDVTFSNTFTPAHQLQTATTSNPTYIWTPAAASDAYQPVNNLNQYQSINGAFLTWDGNGNLLSQNNGAWTYNHDPENRMLQARAVDGSMTMTMENDPEGRRSAKTVRTPDLTITRFLHEGPSEIGEYTQFGGLIRRFIPGAAIDDYVAMEMPGPNDGDTGTKTFFHTDRQGSVIAMADNTGALAEGPYTYDAYGNCFVGASTTSCTTLPTTTVPFHYTGQRFDPETGLYYYRARYYSPTLGRFAETDPVGFGPDINWYSYVGNDPMDGSDPSGNATLPTPIGLLPLEWLESPGTLEEKASTLETIAAGVAFAGAIPEPGTPELEIAALGLHGLASGLRAADSVIHGNSRQSNNPQHIYVLRDSKGRILKYGLSGQPLNKNGSSPRANSQVNGLENKYGAGVTAKLVQTGIQGRGAGLTAERAIVSNARASGEELREQQRPK